MKKLSRLRLEQAAWQLLESAGITRPPVNVERIARKIGYRVVFQHLNGDVSGTVIREDDASITIGINTFHAEVRQRFSIAHEIGHAQLHVGKNKGQVFVDPPARVLFRDGVSSLGEDPKEIEANQFAAGLLMPRQFLATIGKQLTDRNPRIPVDELVYALAGRFQVSNQAMRYRLVTLGVLEPE